MNWKEWSYAGASVVAAGTVWRAAVFPTLRRFRKAWRTVDSIWDEFQPNHGSSLRDRVDSLHAKVDHAVTIGEHAKTLAEVAKMAAETGQALIVAGKHRDEQIERELKEFIDYQRGRNHAILNSLMTIQTSSEVKQMLVDISNELSNKPQTG